MIELFFDFISKILNRAIEENNVEMVRYAINTGTIYSYSIFAKTQNKQILTLLIDDLDKVIVDEHITLAKIIFSYLRHDQLQLLISLCASHNHRDIIDVFIQHGIVAVLMQQIIINGNIDLFKILHCIDDLNPHITILDSHCISKKIEMIKFLYDQYYELNHT